MNEILIFRYYEFYAKVTNVPDYISMEQILDAYSHYNGVGRDTISGIWVFPGSDVDFKNLGVQ